MKNFHWGHAIFIFFVFYIGALAFVMFQTTQVNHNLVVDDYYAQDLAYQGKYDKIENAGRDNKTISPSWNQLKKEFIVVFDSNQSKQGVIILYNPTNKFKDQRMPFHDIVNDTVIFENIVLSPGRWKVQSDWSENGVAYYLEQEIYITNK